MEPMKDQPSTVESIQAVGHKHKTLNLNHKRDIWSLPASKCHSFDSGSNVQYAKSIPKQTI